MTTETYKFEALQEEILYHDSEDDDECPYNNRG